MPETSTPNSDKQLLDPHGTPLPKRRTSKERWTALSLRAKVGVLSLVGIVAVIATLLGNVQKIQDFFKTPPAPPTVPPIIVEIQNSSDRPIQILPRGDFYLWLPGPGARHAFGKYEFRKLDRTIVESQTLTIDANSDTRLLAQILDQETYAVILEKGDCDVAVMVRKANGGHRTTGNIAFTTDSIKNYCVSVDIGAQ